MLKLFKNNFYNKLWHCKRLSKKQGNWLFKRRGVLPIFVLVIGLGIYLLTLEMQGMMFSALAPYWIYYEFFCLLVSLLGVFVRIYTVGHTPANTSGRNTEKQVADSLNKTGIYSTVRHPLYLGNFLMYFGISLLTCNIAFILIFILVFWLYYERIMYAEEQFLRRKFSEEYLAWSEHVPAFFPKFKGFVKPSLTFSWKKVLKKEKNGVFFLFLIFCIFNLCGWWLCPQYIHLNWAIIVLAIFTGLSYMVLKILKTKTKVLDEEGR